MAETVTDTLMTYWNGRNSELNVAIGLRTVYNELHELRSW